MMTVRNSEGITGIEAVGVSIRERERSPEKDYLVEDLANYLAEIVERFCGECDDGSNKNFFSGILILIDEADTASRELNLGAFLKLLTEYLNKIKCNKVIFGLSGLPKLVDVLKESTLPL